MGRYGLKKDSLPVTPFKPDGKTLTLGHLLLVPLALFVDPTCPVYYGPHACPDSRTERRLDPNILLGDEANSAG